jgi:hypothetical protein
VLRVSQAFVRSAPRLSAQVPRPALNGRVVDAASEDPIEAQRNPRIGPLDNRSPHG